MGETRSRLRKDAWIAVLAGLLLAVVLWLASYWMGDSHNVFNYFVFGLQFMGWWACIVLRGIHSATMTDFGEIGIPINAVIYTAAIFCVLRILAKIKNSN